jgi:hypothetical protein
MRFNMVLGCFFFVVLSMQMVTMRQIGMVCPLLMVTGAIMLGHFPVPPP